MLWFILIRINGQTFKGRKRKASAYKSGNDADAKEGVFQSDVRALV